MKQLDLGKDLQKDTFNAAIDFDNNWRCKDKVKMNATKDYVSQTTRNKKIRPSLSQIQQPIYKEEKLFSV